MPISSPRHIIPSLSAALLISATAPAAWSQPLVLGPTAGYEYGIPLSINRVPGAVNPYPNFDGTGESRNHSLWLGMRTAMPDLFAPELGISSLVGIVMSKGTFHSHTFFGDPVLNSTDWTINAPLKEFELDVTTASLRFELGLIYSLGRVSLGVAPSLAYRFSDEYIYSERIVDDSTGVAGPQTNFSRSESMGNSRLSGGMALHGSVRIPIGERLALQPEARLTIDGNALNDELGGRSFGGGFGVTLLFGAGPSADPLVGTASAPIIVDAVIPPPPSGPGRPEAFIDLYSTDPYGRRMERATVGTREVLHRTSTALIPRIFFEPDSAALPAPYRSMSRNQTTAFHTDSLAGLDLPTVQRHLLDVIGLRMQGNPTVGISVLGTATGEEPEMLAGARAESVRKYLKEVWGIDERRIRTGAAGGRNGIAPQGAGRSALIRPDRPEITAPLENRWLVEDLAVPTIGVDPRITTPAGLNQWTIMIRQGEHEIARYSSLDEEEPEAIDLAFLLSDERTDSVLTPLVAELAVEDSAGVIVSARDTLQLRWEEPSPPASLGDGGDGGDETSHRLEKISYFLLDSPAGEDPHAVPPDRIAETVRNGAHVTLTTPPETGLQGTDVRSAAQLAERLLGAIRERGTTLGEFHILTTGETADPLESQIRDSGIVVEIEQNLPDGKPQ